jgi:urease accessory protein
MSVRMGWGATLSIRESVVLGRQAEPPGRLRQRVVVSGENGVPILHEGLDVGPESSRLLLGGGRVIGTVLQVGRRLPRSVDHPDWTWFDLEANGTLARSVAVEAHELGLDRVWSLVG